MKIYRWIYIVYALVLLFGISCKKEIAKKPGVYYVSIYGNDNWSGMISRENWQQTDGPFASLEKARKTIRELKRTGKMPEGGVTINIRGGVYAILETFKLNIQDSGREDSPVTYRAYEDEKVIIIGGKVVADFKKLDDSDMLKRIPLEFHDKIYQIDLKQQGVENFGELKNKGFARPIEPAPLELFFMDKPMPIARWPNQGWTEIASVPEQDGMFKYKGNRPERWAKTDNIWLHGYWTHDWADSYEKVKAIDKDKKIIKTYQPHGVYGYSKGARYYVLNVPEELDQPGEWYLDREKGKIYFWPPAPLNEYNMFVSVLEKPFISLENTTDINIEGIQFKYSRGAGIVIIGGMRNRIAGCTFENLGTFAVSIEGGIKNGVNSCDISETGEGGIILKGGDRKNLTPAGNFAINNHIQKYNRWVRTYRPAIHIYGVKNIVSNNLIHNAPHNAILLHGNEHIIQYNEIHNVCNETSDAGAFYMGRDWTERGNKIRYNYFHDISGTAKGIGTVAIYLDDWASGTTVYGNICYKTDFGVLIGGGRDNIIKNNIFLFCKPAVHIDSRGKGWASKYFDGTNTTLKDRMNAVNFDQPPYSEKYPELLTLYDDEPDVAKGNLVTLNISYGGRWLDLKNGLTAEIVKIKNNLVNINPRFKNLKNRDFRLDDNSPALKMGFEPIPVNQIGLYKDKFRKDLPNTK